MKKKSLLLTGALAVSLLAAPTTSLASSGEGSSYKVETHKVQANQLVDWFADNKEALRSGDIDIQSLFDEFKIEPKHAPKELEKEVPEKQKQPEAAPAPKEEQPEVEQPKQEETEQANSEVSAFEQQVVELTNKERTERGLEPLQLDTELSAVAKDKSLDMKNKGYFSHNSPTYGSPFDMMKAYGIDYRAAGENIAMGQPSPDEVVDAWMNSEGHRKNILNPDFTHIGVGHVENGDYWTQMFIGK
ncbi:CAP domain-containing protein [Halobacillus salinus]|uniref:SCP domain-containing protein n=1 Tax=Halobacillus salinus TaxID=192814 RepID=A0A4Z0H323_9BACI|nr:CAP domain-containing protein [Halobacillus salinus]TGB03811.1 hypothetical protein E4663_02035 [Halobacillus salinus]